MNSETNQLKRAKKLDRKRLSVSLIITYIIVTLWAIFSVIPLYWMGNMSLQYLGNAEYVKPVWLVTKPIIENYQNLFSSYPTARWLLNSLIVASVVTLSNVVFASIAGYSFAKLKFPGKNKIFWVLLSSLMIPFQVTLIPMYILFVNILGLSDTYLGLIIPPLCTINNVFLMKQYMSTLPTSLIHAGRIDGCSEIGVFRKIILPIAKPGIAVMAIFTFVAVWNDFFWAFLMTSSSEMRTIQVGLTMFSSSLDTDWGAIMAGSVVAALPMFILFFSLQKYFLKGITIGAVKG